MTLIGLPRGNEAGNNDESRSIPHIASNSAEQSSNYAERETFDYHLAHDARAAGSQTCADCQFFLPRGSARQ